MEIITLIEGSSKDTTIKKLWNSGYEDNHSINTHYQRSALIMIHNRYVLERGFVAKNKTDFDFKVADFRIFPPYIDQMFHSGEVYDPPFGKSLYEFDWESKLKLELNSAFTFVHFNCVYGHWLLEMFPKLFLLDEIYKKNIKIPILIPNYLPSFVENFALELNPDFEIIKFDPSKEIVFVKYLYVVGFETIGFDTTSWWGSDFYMNKFHSIAENSNLDIDFKKIILKRPENHRSIRSFKNYSRIEEIARNHGFTVIDPSSLGSLFSQAKLFNNADYIIGEFNSSLHGAIFNRNSAVVSLNYINNLQNEIAIASKQSIGYIIPVEGPCDWNREIDFTISEEEFRTKIEYLIY